MPVLETRNFGPIEYDDEAAFHFPRGLPGFEDERHFLPIERAGAHPLLFLQSAAQPGLCFVTLPVLVVDGRYRLTIEAEERALLGLAPEREPAIGRDVLCLAVVTIPAQGEPTANLLAPVVVNLATRVGAQVVQNDSGYSCRHPIPGGENSEGKC